MIDFDNKCVILEMQCTNPLLLFTCEYQTKIVQASRGIQHIKSSFGEILIHGHSRYRSVVVGYIGM